MLGDAAYGDDTALRDWLSEQNLVYALGVRPGTTVWWGEHQPVSAPAAGFRGKTKTHLTRDSHHQPISVLELAQTLAPQCFRSVTWRQGVSEPLRSRFARVRVRAAHRDLPRAEEWLVIEWPKGETEPTRYWMSTHPKDMIFAALVDSIKARWRIERDDQELKQEFGLGHYEGRNWRGAHSSCEPMHRGVWVFDARTPVRLQKKQRSIQRTCPTQKLPPARRRARCDGMRRTRSPRYAFGWRASLRGLCHSAPAAAVHQSA